LLHRLKSFFDVAETLAALARCCGELARCRRERYQ
jgi:hypothetical protein